MKQFFKFMFASMLGFFVCLVLCFFIIGGIISMMISSATSDKITHVEPNSVLQINFKSEIKDRGSKNPFETFDFNSFENKSQPGLNETIESIEKAAADPNIKGIYLDLSDVESGLASLEDIRNALINFKKSGKFIFSYAEYYSQASYYLASTADQVWLNPMGVVDIRGFKAVMPFFKGLLEKLEIEPQVIRHGKFKSAIEPFILDKMSDENRLQTATYVNSFWSQYINGIGKSRNISVDQMELIADSALSQTADDAIKLKLVDKIGYMDEFLDAIKLKSGISTSTDLKAISLKKYSSSPKAKNDKPYTRDKIAVIYAAGDIVNGKGNNDQIGAESLSETIRKARKDDRVKAIVLRVNSPGGDALASEIIWREVKLCRAQKPVVVSMGNLAASGGYYISCAADTIVAEPNTITGSIGVFGLLFNGQKMLNDKLGITFDVYKTGPYADMAEFVRPLTDSERHIMQNSVERVYDIFTQRVADGRGIEKAMVDSIGQGRVWSGRDAQKIGLVDVLGGLDDAVAIAAKMAHLDNYRISELPEEKEPLQMIMEDLNGEAETKWMKFKMGDAFEYVKMYHEISQLKGVQAKLMWGIDNQ